MNNEDASGEGFFAGETGATMVEYALLLALIAMACTWALTMLGCGLERVFRNAAEVFDDFGGG